MRSTRWRRLRGLALFALACCALGLATTIAVAWSLAAWLPNRALIWSMSFESFAKSGPEQFTDPPLEVEQLSRAGMVRRSWFLHRWTATYGPSPIVWGTDSRPDNNLEWRPNYRWGRLPRSLAEAQAAKHFIEDARGWPFLALWCQFDYNWDRRRTSAIGALALSPTSTPLADFRALPLRPIPRGLLLDTALYAAAWALLLTLAATRPLRRIRRRARGHCPACGYDLASLPACPECGWNRS
jgi:hypothetical protein